MYDKQPSIAVPEACALNRLHAATCLLMTRFSLYQCPKLAQLIVQQLDRLLAHPDLAHSSPSRQTYLQLQAHWQKVTATLLSQREMAQNRGSFH